MGILSFLGYIVPFIIALVVIVFIHELGHFLVARFLGSKSKLFRLALAKSFSAGPTARELTGKFVRCQLADM